MPLVLLIAIESFAKPVPLVTLTSRLLPVSDCAVVSPDHELQNP